MKDHLYVILTVLFTQEDDGTWLARCEELGTSTYGNTFEEVKVEIGELIKLHLDTLEKNGERERFLAENRIPLYSKDVPETIVTDIPVRPNTLVKTYAQELHFA